MAVRPRTWIAPALIALVALVPAPPRSQSSTAAEAAVAPPNIVLILADDQRWDQLGAMPAVGAGLAEEGVTFGRATVVDPVCCPSRLSILRGQLSHTTGIYRISPPHGGFDLIRRRGLESSTLATWLDAAGYRTAMIGKYLNGYSVEDFDHVPPGWDAWRAFSTSGTVPYFDYSMSVDGTTVAFGDADEDYSTDVLAGFADAFIRGTPADEPLFLYLAPGAPHTPRTPAPRHATSNACVDRVPPPSLGEADVTDKPTYVQALPWASTSGPKAARAWVKSCRSLLAVDDLVAGVLDALADTGRLGTSLIAYSSDNGHLIGEHRYFNKKVPYEESIRVPMVLRYDAVVGSPGATKSRLVTNVDLTATFADAAGVVPPYALEGESLLPLLAGTVPTWRDTILIEHYDQLGKPDFIPTWCAVRTARYLYARYDADLEPRTEELYDLRADPFQLDNLLPSSSASVNALRDDLLGRLRSRCEPAPPDFTW